MAQSKKRSARAAVKNGKRLKRHGRKPWMAGQPVMKQGMGGTDKGGKNNGRSVYYSQANAERLPGVPGDWPGLPYRGK